MRYRVHITSVSPFFVIYDNKKARYFYQTYCANMVPAAGLEPARDHLPMDFESIASTSFTTQALKIL